KKNWGLPGALPAWTQASSSWSILPDSWPLGGEGWPTDADMRSGTCRQEQKKCRHWNVPQRQQSCLVATAKCWSVHVVAETNFELMHRNALFDGQLVNIPRLG